MAYESVLSFLNRAAQAAPEIHIGPGHSGYFSTPDSGLDPNLFNGDVLKPEVGQLIRDLFYNYMDSRYREARSWSRLWLAGSGISYQWAADRGNGDLDVMVGIDPVDFRRTNPTMAGLSDVELADYINADLRQHLWPATAATTIGRKVYEVTYFWNPGVGADPGDVRAINPYAAYDIIDNSWVVRPPKLPANPRTLYPAEWWQRIDAEAQLARQIIDRYNAARHEAATLTGPRQINALTQMRLAAAQALALWDDIHTGRKAAFGPGGAGYGDWNNFRWQAFKDNGLGPALAEIAKVARSGQEATEAALYGQRIASVEQARIRALLWANRGIQ